MRAYDTDRWAFGKVLDVGMDRGSQVGVPLGRSWADTGYCGAQAVSGAVWGPLGGVVAVVVDDDSYCYPNDRNEQEEGLKGGKGCLHDLKVHREWNHARSAGCVDSADAK